MWGNQPNHLDGRVSEDKTDNTGHLFKISGVTMETYFSPSDETNCHILDALKSANYQVMIGLLLLTKEDLIDEIIALHENGIDIRVIIEDDGTSSLAISRLNQAGVPVAIHNLSGLFHHKYAIIDEGHTDSDPQVVTGSHNWTLSADQINDENTIIFHDQSVTNIFRQEFEARWSELVSTGTISFSNNPVLTLHPNPAADQIEMTNPYSDKCTITLIDVNGNIVGRQKLSPHQTITYMVEPSMPNGIYLVHWSWKDNNAVSRVAIQR
jgi:phosphatidylserine/phosphatidylglycerophosphate/cardiolipin synthase-like enzyme